MKAENQATQTEMMVERVERDSSTNQSDIEVTLENENANTKLLVKVDHQKVMF